MFGTERSLGEFGPGESGTFLLVVGGAGDIDGVMVPEGQNYNFWIFTELFYFFKFFQILSQMPEIMVMMLRRGIKLDKLCLERRVGNF